MSGNLRWKRAGFCTEIYTPHKIVHKVRDNSQLANLPGINILFKEKDLFFAEGVSSAGPWYIVEAVWVVSCVKVSVWS